MTRGAADRRRRVARVIEAAYRVSADPGIWARRILEAALGFDRGLGAYVVVLRVDSGHREPLALASEGWDELPRFLAALSEVTPRLPEHVMGERMIYGSVRRLADVHEDPERQTEVLGRFGLSDLWGLSVGHRGQWLLSIGWPCPRGGVPDEEDLWMRASAHAANALELFVATQEGTLGDAPLSTPGETAASLWDELLRARCFLVQVELADGRGVEVAIPNPDRLELGQGLSERERAIATRLVAGLDYKQVAWELGVSVSTIGTVAGRVLRKLRVRSKLELASLAARTRRIVAPAVPAAVGGLGFLTVPRGLSEEHAPTLAVNERQRELLALVAQGLGDQDIAERLGLSRHTVRNAIARWIKRLGVDSRAALIASISSISEPAARPGG